MDPQPRGPDPVRHQRPGPRGRAGGPDLAPAEEARLDRAVLPLDRHLPRVRDERARHHDRAVRDGQRPLLGRSPDARPLRLRGTSPGLGVVAGRDPDPARGRDRTGGQDPAHRPGRDRDDGRGQLEPGRRARGAQLRRDPQAAVRVHGREQRLCDLGPGGEGAERQGRGGPRVRVRDARRRRRRHGRPRLLRGGKGGGRPRPIRWRAEPDRGQGHPAHGALLGRPADEVPLGRRPRGRQGPRSAADLPDDAAGRRRADGRDRGGAHGRDHRHRRRRDRLRRGRSPIPIPRPRSTGSTASTGRARRRRRGTARPAATADEAH